MKIIISCKSSDEDKNVKPHFIIVNAIKESFRSLILFVKYSGISYLSKLEEQFKAFPEKQNFDKLEISFAGISRKELEMVSKLLAVANHEFNHRTFTAQDTPFYSVKEEVEVESEIFEEVIQYIKRFFISSLVHHGFLAIAIKDVDEKKIHLSGWGERWLIEIKKEE